MARIDLRKFALRLKVVEMIGIYARRRIAEDALRCKVAEMIQRHARRRLLEEARVYWRRLILPN